MTTPHTQCQPEAAALRQESRTIYDPFLGKDVQISDRITDRLRGRYAQGPTMADGEPEFGWREFQTPPIQHEAAALITSLAVEHALMAAEIAALKSRVEELTKALEPFAIFANRFGDTAREDGWQLTNNPSSKGNLTMGDVRAARRAYSVSLEQRDSK